MSIDAEHGLRVELATALRERDEARTDAANLRFVNDKARESLAAANARADAAEALAEDRRKARATVAAMYEAVREAELRPPLATYLEMRREGPNAPLQYYAMKPEKVTGFYGALRERWNGTDVERWTKEFVEARDRVSASESALPAARRECEELRQALSDLIQEMEFGGGCDGTDPSCDGCIAVESARAALAAPASAPGEETKR